MLDGWSLDTHRNNNAMSWVRFVTANAVSVLVGGMIPIVAILLKYRIDRRRRLADWFEEKYIQDSVDVLHEFFSKWAFLSGLPARNVQELLAHPAFADIPSQAASRLAVITGRTAFHNWFNAMRALWLRAAHRGEWGDSVKFHTSAASFCGLLDALRGELLRVTLAQKADIYTFRRLSWVEHFNHSLDRLTDDLNNDPNVTTYSRCEDPVARAENHPSQPTGVDCMNAPKESSSQKDCSPPAQMRTWDEYVVSTFGGIVSDLAKAASLLIALTLIAWCVGWIRAYAYYQGFGAEWLVAELSPGQLLSFALWPVVCLLMSFAVITTDIAEGLLGKQRRTALGIIICLYVLAVILSLSASWTGFYQRAAWTAWTALALNASVVVGDFAGDVVIAGRRWQSRLVWALFVGGAVFLGHCSYLGSIEGRRDRSSAHSTLPVVTFVEVREGDWRLLRASDRLMYVTDVAADSDSAPPVRVVDSNDIAAIQRRQRTVSPPSGPTTNSKPTTSTR